MSKDQGHKELDALIRLLDEPDQKTFDKIRDKIFSHGLIAIPSLEDAWANSFDQIIQERSLNLIHEIQFEQNVFDLNKWALFENKDLLRGYMIFSKYNYPDLDESKMMNQIAKLIQDIWLELNDELTALEKIKVVNHVLFNIHKFRGNKKNFYSPDNFSVNNVLERKMGNPTALGVLYLSICHKLKIPVAGVNLPKHFVLAYVDHKNNDEIMFYINPFNQGAVFTKNEIDLYIGQLKIDKKDEYYKVCDHLCIMNRMIDDLILAYTKLGYEEKISELKKLKSAIS